jgi:septal ring factor EnvC (AmiA/AmiB activator)
MCRDTMWMLLTVFAAWAVSGCTLMNQYQDVQATQQRVQYKEADLAQEQAIQEELNRQTRQLSADLANRQMTAGQLDQRLAALQKQNDRLAATNATEREKTAKLRQQIAGYRAQLNALEHDTTSNPDDIRVKIDQVKLEIRQRLEVQAGVRSTPAAPPHE